MASPSAASPCFSVHRRMAFGFRYDLCGTCRMNIVSCDRHHDIICKMAGIHYCWAVFCICVSIVSWFRGQMLQICHQNDPEMALGSSWGSLGSALGALGTPWCPPWQSLGVFGGRWEGLRRPNGLVLGPTRGQM